MNGTTEKTKEHLRKSGADRPSSWKQLLNSLLRIQEYVGKIESIVLVICMIFMSLLVTFLLMGRYFHIPFPWAQEAAQYCLIFLVFFGASKGAHYECHIGTDIFLKVFHGKTRKVLMFVAPVLFAAFGLVFAIISVNYVSFTHKLHRTTSTLPYSIPFSYILAPFIISFVTLTFHASVTIMKKLIMPGGGNK